MVHPRAAPPPAPPHAWVSVCVSYSGGASSEWSPPPANAAAASRGLRESRAGGDSGCGLVFTVIVASPCLGGLLRSGLLLLRECASTVITRSLPELPTHPKLVRVESDPRTSVSLDRYRAERPGGRGHAEGSTFLSGQGALGQTGESHGGGGDSPGSQLLSPPPSQFEEGYLKTGTPAGPGEVEEGVKPDRRSGLQTSLEVRPPGS